MNHFDSTDIGLHDDGSFRFHIPISLAKSKDGKIWIEGIASREKQDITGETVIQKGMDLSYFIKRGFFNDNHAKDTSGKVGIPTEAQITKDGLYVKGYMLDTPRAQAIVELAESLAKSGSERKLGFSVEGKVRERDGKIIKKSWIKDVAITAEPICADTYMSICKSISDRIAQDGYIEEDDTYTTAIQSMFLDKLIQTVTDTISKSLEAGVQRPPESDGSALRKESLEGELHNLDVPEEEAEDAKEENIGEPEAQGKKKAKKLTKAQTVELIKAKGHSQKTAERMAGLIFDDAVRQSIVGQ